MILKVAILALFYSAVAATRTIGDEVLALPVLRRLDTTTTTADHDETDGTTPTTGGDHVPTDETTTSSMTSTVRIISEDPNLSFGQWQYREVTTCLWNPICYGWDFLQGGGFFPMTWFTYPEPTVSIDGGKSIHDYNIERTCWASFCQAEPDGINSFLEVTYSNRQGNLIIVPDNSAGTSTTVKCGPQGSIQNPSGCTTCSIVCQEARVKWNGRNNVQVTVLWQDR